MTRTRQDINRRAAAARRIVLRRLADERPRVYQRWMAEAYAALDADEAQAVNDQPAPAPPRCG